MKHLPLSILLMVALLAMAASGQVLICNIGDDGFDVGCCNAPQPNLPVFPSVTSSARWGCLLNCQFENDFMASLTLGAPQFVTCDQALISIGVTPLAAVGPSFSGFLVAKYARTWTRPSSSPLGGPGAQVWRFLLNGDVVFQPNPTGAVGCPVPSCAGATTANVPVHLWGSIDYICTPPTPISPGGWEIRLDLTHGPGCLQHAPWSARPLAGPAGHPERSYHLLAPSTFIFGPHPAPAGGIAGDSVRDALVTPSSAVFYQCFGEADVVQGSLSTVTQNCLCTSVVPVTGPWHHQDLNVSVACGPALTLGVSSVSLPGFITPTGLVALTLGSYGTPAGGPGEDLTIYWGVFQYAPPCAPNNFPFHVVHGVGTSGIPGVTFPPTPGIAPFQDFLDFQNHKLLSSPLGPFQPGFGAPAVGDEVFSFNLF